VLNELLEKGVIEKKGKEYELDLKWITSLKKFTEQHLSRSNKNQTILEAINQDVSNFYFDDLASVDRFILSVAEIIEKSETLYFYWFHCWNPLFFSKEGYSNIKELAENASLYVIIKGNTPLDEWCGKNIKRFKQNKFKLGIKDLNMPEFLIYEDYIFQVFYPKDIVKKVNNEFRKIKKIEDLNLDKLSTNVFERKTGIPIIVNKNPILAKKLKEKIKSYF